MTPPVQKRTADPQPSRDEKKAQAWHKRRHPDTRADCWCCCPECQRENPHHLAARKAAVKDIFARIADSLASTRLPKPSEHEWPWAP
jgi:hypothetical protein